MLRILGLFSFLVILAIVSVMFLGVQANNADRPWPQNNEYQTAFDFAADWVKDNESSLMQEHNSALWYMVMRAARTSGDERLTSVFERYRKSVIDRRPRNVWTPYFEPDYKPWVPPISEMTLKPYQIMLIYSLSCDEKLGKEPLIREQLEAEYCSLHYLRTRCVTHQMMAVIDIEKRGCTDTGNLRDELAEIIVDELTWDFRVTDSYIQRLLSLYESGHHARIKPVWVQRFLEAQRDDGGWGDYYAIVGSGSTSLGTKSTQLAKGPGRSNFHATAQALMLLAILIDRQA